MTVVVLMGVARLAGITAALIDGGRSPDTPVAMIERATTPAQRVIRGTLDTIAVDAIVLGVRSPAVVVIGDVAARCDAPPPLIPTDDARSAERWRYPSAAGCPGARPADETASRPARRTAAGSRRGRGGDRGVASRPVGGRAGVTAGRRRRRSGPADRRGAAPR